MFKKEYSFNNKLHYGRLNDKHTLFTDTYPLNGQWKFKIKMVPKSVEIFPGYYIDVILQEIEINTNTCTTILQVRWYGIRLTNAG